MFPSFIGILDIQSWWEVPSIAYFCSLFRTAFNLLDFDIEELEEALLTDGTEESASSLLTELIVRLLNGCLGNNDISAFNYQMYLRRLFRRKCQETGRYNPFNTDIDFQFLPLRTKVEILYALCDFRLDADDVFDLFKNLEAESLRVEPLGYDSQESAYWYFYGTRLYREDIIKKPKGKNKKKKPKEPKKRSGFGWDDFLNDELEESERVWQVVCFTEEDWSHLTQKFSKATGKVEKELYRSLSQNFLPEIPRLFQEKERLQRKRLLAAPRRTSSRVLSKIKASGKSEDSNTVSADSKDEPDEESKPERDQAREDRAKRRDQIREKSEDSESSDSTNDKMPLKTTKRSKSQDKRSKNSVAASKGEPPPGQLLKTGRKTNNSLASATGQIVIPDAVEPANSMRRKLKTSQVFSQTEDIQIDMYKVLEQLTAHDDAWPFLDPVEEDCAPNYYAVIRRPMDLRKMEERLDNGYYTDFSMFKADFKLIVNNCRLFNGQDNEYTQMVDNLQAAFDRLTDKYIHRMSSSDEEIAVEYQMPAPSRKHKLKSTDSPPNHKRRKRKSHSDATGEERSSDLDDHDEPTGKDRESHKSRDGRIKKKRKGHRHGKHSKNHKKDHKTGHISKSTKHSKRRGKDKDSKKSKQKKKKSKHGQDGKGEPSEAGAGGSDEFPRSASRQSLESSTRSRSASPLPSIHTPTPTPSRSPSPPAAAAAADSPPPEPEPEPDFYKDKYDKIKERRRNANKKDPTNNWENLFEDQTEHKQKQNLYIPEKEKNQKLRETIEKLKAKNEKYSTSPSLFNSLFTPGQSAPDEKHKPKKKDKEPANKDRDRDNDLTDDDAPEKSSKATKKTSKKKASAKNESASEALEQAVKDISKWLDEAPRGSCHSSPCDSPAQTISTEEQDSRHGDELGDKPHAKPPRKRPSSREPKLLKRREIQRTIDRLQPGKGKGNLISSITTNKPTEKVEEVAPSGPLKARDPPARPDESSPKLSLGSVLQTVEFTLGKDHNFDNDETEQKEVKADETTKEAEKEVEKEAAPEEPKKDVVEQEVKKKEEVKVEEEPPVTKANLSQERATPNLSAWFKAFGAPKSTSSAPAPKKKEEADDEKPAESVKDEAKSSPKQAAKYDSPSDEPAAEAGEGGAGAGAGAGGTPRARRTSTGSSVSERSSFSQDLDSPRHQLSHTSPLLRSPASPRADDFQKISYPIINGTVRAGFYQDATSMKSSPEKSCSPREAPHSPYSPYSQHVYANNHSGSSTPNYFIDNKSPLPTYGQIQPPPYYDTAKATAVSKPRAHDDYTALGPGTYQPYSPAHSPYAAQPVAAAAAAARPQRSPPLDQPDEPPPAAPHAPDQTLFPVKKRTYSDPDALKHKEPTAKSEYDKIVHSMQAISSLPSASVDDIAAALTEKSELAKLSALRDLPAPAPASAAPTSAPAAPTPAAPAPAAAHEYPRDAAYEPEHKKKDSTVPDPTRPIGMTKSDNVDMINMGYMNPELERRALAEHPHEHYANRDAYKSAMSAQPKGYEIDAIAMNLGMGGHGQQKTHKASSMPPAAHSLDRGNTDIGLSHHMMPHPGYDMQAAAGGNFSLTDIELANKKLYQCAPAPPAAAIDYGGWKMNSQVRKEVLPSDYSAYANKKQEAAPAAHSGPAAHPVHAAHPAPAAAHAYSKSMQQQQPAYHNYSVQPRGTLQGMQAELRIPNPRSHLKPEQAAPVAADHAANTQDAASKAQKQQQDKLDRQIQNHPLVGSLQYKTAYGGHSALEELRGMPNMSQMLERYSNDERYLSSFYHDKTFQMAQMSHMFNKSMAEGQSAAAAAPAAYSQPPAAGKEPLYKTSPGAPPEPKAKPKRKRTSEAKQPARMSGQQFHGAPCASDVLAKSSMVPGSAFNFGAGNMLGGCLYPDNGGFTIDDFRNSTASQLMAANYMAAARGAGGGAAGGSTGEGGAGAAGAAAAGDKLKPAHQAAAAAGGGFGFMGAGQVRGGAGYGFDYQYLQRHQEELLRQTNAQIMAAGLYPPGYPRQPYDSINRPSWL